MWLKYLLYYGDGMVLGYKYHEERCEAVLGGYARYRQEIARIGKALFGRHGVLVYTQRNKVQFRINGVPEDKHDRALEAFRGNRVVIQQVKALGRLIS